MYKKSGTRRKKMSGTVWQLVLQNLNIELPYDPAITLLGIHSEERKQTPEAMCTTMFIAMAHTSPQMDKSQSSPMTGWNITQPLKGRHSDGCSNKNKPRRHQSKLANNQGTHSVGLHSLTVPKAVKFMETVWLAGASEGRHGAGEMSVLRIGSVWLCSNGKLPVPISVYLKGFRW